MLKKAFRFIINAFRFIGKPCYVHLLCVNVSTTVGISKKGTFYVGRRFRTRKNVEINVRDNAEICIGNDVFFNTGCIIVARECIEIGDGTIFGPYVQIIDHYHEFSQGEVLENSFSTSSIVIGSHCWIGAGTIILKGTVLGDHCIAGAGSILKGKYSDNSIIIQKRNTINKRQECP